MVYQLRHFDAKLPIWQHEFSCPLAQAEREVLPMAMSAIVEACGAPWNFGGFRKMDGAGPLEFEITVSYPRGSFTYLLETQKAPV